MYKEINIFGVLFCFFNFTLLIVNILLILVAIFLIEITIQM